MCDRERGGNKDKQQETKEPDTALTPHRNPGDTHPPRPHRPAITQPTHVNIMLETHTASAGRAGAGAPGRGADM
jgi:hypothetical protein